MTGGPGSLNSAVFVPSHNNWCSYPPPKQLHPVCATASTDPTAVSASDVAGDTPWTSLGPIFHGNLAIFHITHPPELAAHTCSVSPSSVPAGRIFVVSEATDGEYSPLSSLICPRQTFRSTKATRPFILEENLLSTFGRRVQRNDGLLVGRCSIPPPHNYNT